MFVIAGVIMVPVSFALFYAPWQYYVYADPAKSSPRHFMMKTGFVLLMLSAFWLYEQRRRPSPSFLSIAGQETLMVYGLHLVIVYGASFTSFSIAKMVGRSLTVLPSLSISFLLILSMIAAALLWHSLKRNRPKLAKYFFYALCILYFVPFFFT